MELNDFRTAVLTAREAVNGLNTDPSLEALVNDLTPIDVVGALGVVGDLGTQCYMLAATLSDALTAFAEEATELVVGADGDGT